MDKYMSEIEKLKEIYNEINLEIDETSQQIQVRIDSLGAILKEEREISGELDRLETVQSYKGIGGIKEILKDFIKTPFATLKQMAKDLTKDIAGKFTLIGIIIIEIISISIGMWWLIPAPFGIALVLCGGITAAIKSNIILKEKNRYKDIDINYELEECERKLCELFTQKRESILTFHELFFKGQDLSTRIKEISSEIESLQQEREEVINRIVPEVAINQEFDKARSRKRQNQE